MWLLFGILAIITAFCNWGWAANGKDPRFFRFISLSCTALTVCGFYQNVKTWVLCGDYSALGDVVPTVTTALWVLVVASIVINGVTLWALQDKQ